MINHTIAEFLGIWLIGVPFLFFVILIILRGIFWIIEHFFEDETIKRFFHHHIHYRAIKDNKESKKQ